MSGNREGGSSVRFGVDRVIGDRSLLGGGRSFGLLTNDAARLSRSTSVRSRAALLEAGVPLRRLFSPEHGLTAAAADGSAVANSIDPATGLEVVSLYGERFAPPVDALRDLDALLVDLPDAGARFYTYAWTMTHAIDACATSGTPVLVLDRPNPIGGELACAEGPLLEPGLESMMGRFAIPVRHSLTIGELARLWQRERAPAARVDVVAMEGWRRVMHWPDTGLEFVPMSPAMPSCETALFYPGTSLFEATNVSVGRESPAPFRRLSARWLAAERVVAALRGDDRAAGADVVADGSVLLLSASEPRRVRPVALGVALLEAIGATHPREFEWRPYPTAANPSGRDHLDRLVGTPRVREAIDAGRRVPDHVLATGDWDTRAGPILLYD